MKKISFSNLRRKRTKLISSAEYGSPLTLRDRSEEIRALVNKEAEIMEPVLNRIPEHINAVERTRFKEKKESVNWSIFFKTAVYQFKP